MTWRDRLRALVPTRESLMANRWLRWLSPWLGHPRLWHWSRRGVALGVAIGVFFGLLIPLAQIPFAAAAAVVLRANLPAAAASTLITNPVTFGPVYFAAYRLGGWLIGEPTGPTSVAEKVAAETEISFIERVAALGKPLLLGLAIMAIVVGLVVYGLVHLAWRWRTGRRWRSRRDGAPQSPGSDR